MSYSKRSIVNEQFEKMNDSNANIVNTPFTPTAQALTIPNKTTDSTPSNSLVSSNDFVALLSEEYNRSKEATRRAVVPPAR